MASAVFFLDLKGKVRSVYQRDGTTTVQQTDWTDPPGPQLPRGHSYVRRREFPYPPQRSRRREFRGAAVFLP